MTFDDIVLKDAPTRKSFWNKFHDEFIRWVVYVPKDTIEEEDLPIGDKWWILLHWMPKIKRELYTLLLQRGLTGVEHRLYDELGIDPIYFNRDYDFFIRRLKQIKKLNTASKHLGETGV
jgi:hypothetical protein